MKTNASGRSFETTPISVLLPSTDTITRSCRSESGKRRHHTYAADNMLTTGSAELSPEALGCAIAEHQLACPWPKYATPAGVS